MTKREIKGTYRARGKCLNCGVRNYPQWGSYENGKKVNDYPCYACHCMTWVVDSYEPDLDVGKTNESLPTPETK